VKKLLHPSSFYQSTVSLNNPLLLFQFQQNGLKNGRVILLF